MNTRTPQPRSVRTPLGRPFFLVALALFVSASASCHRVQTFAQDKTATSTTAASNTAARTPSDVVREFYRAMREKRFRDAFAMSIYRPAVEGLSAAEYDELRPDFERLAGVVLEKVVISGEQVSGDTATVFGKFTEEDAAEAPKPVTLMRSGNVWIIGDSASQEVVRKQGRDFFFNARVETHHGEVRALLQRIAVAQLAYSVKHGGLFGELSALVGEGLVPADELKPEATGYRFHVTLGKGGKDYSAGAEPLSYGRTGRLSFYMDPKGMK
ncbi:MAG: hypothetical protein ACRD68_09490, partial [Pyrinomonadaceae bacterium]